METYTNANPTVPSSSLGGPISLAFLPFVYCDDIANQTASKVGSKKGRKDMASKPVSGNAGELHIRIVLCLGECQIDSVSHRPEMKVGCQRPKELMVQ